MLPPSKSFNVYVRWRPLSLSEPAAAEIDHASLTHDNSYLSVSLASQTKSGKPSSWNSAASFTSVFEANMDNIFVFENVVEPTLPQVLAGSTCNFFAYGHSGSGKTHTIIGYDHDEGGQLGLCPAAARDLFAALDKLNAADNEDENSRLCIALRLYEIRRKSAFDLLNNHNECHVRQGEDGKTHIRGETEMLEDGKVRVRPIVAIPCWSFEELRQRLQAGLKLRATGSSSVHDQSSRTHAVLELEVVSQALLDAREDVVERQSELVPVGKNATGVYLDEMAKTLVKDAEGNWTHRPDRPVDQPRIDAAEAKKKEFEAYLKTCEMRLAEVWLSGRQRQSCLGGKFVFVDLAGSEYFGQGAELTSQTAQERQEGRQINTDLFALKEVIRARALNQARIPFRSAPLTMVLREHFEGDMDSYSAMILNVAPEAEQFAATMNTLKYGNLVGVAGGVKIGPVKS